MTSSAHCHQQPPGRSRGAPDRWSTPGTFITLGTAIDAGTFAPVGPAVEKADDGLPVILVLAGMVAFATATGGAQVCAAIPRSGVEFTCARAIGHQTISFLAGTCFVGKGVGHSKRQCAHVGCLRPTRRACPATQPRWAAAILAATALTM